MHKLSNYVCSSGWYLVVLGQYGAELVGTWWYWVNITASNSIKLYWVSKVLVCLYI